MTIDPALLASLLELAAAARAAYEKPSVKASNPDLGQALARYDRVRADLAALENER